MKDLTLFNSLYVVEAPKFFDNGNTVEFRTVKSSDRNPIPGMFKLRCKRPSYIPISDFIEGFGSIVQGDIVTALGTPDAYRSKFYGKRRTPIKASNGKLYYVNRNRYNIKKIKKGANNLEVIKLAHEIIGNAIKAIKKERNHGTNTLFHRA